MSYLSISLNRLLSSPDKRAIDYCCVRPCAADSLQPPSFFFFVVVAVSYAPRPEGQQLSKRDLGKHTQKKKKKDIEFQLYHGHPGYQNIYPPCLPTSYGVHAIPVGQGKSNKVSSSRQQGRGPLAPAMVINSESVPSRLVDRLIGRTAFSQTPPTKVFQALSFLFLHAKPPGG